MVEVLVVIEYSVLQQAERRMIRWMCSDKVKEMRE